VVAAELGEFEVRIAKAIDVPRRMGWPLPFFAVAVTGNEVEITGGFESAANGADFRDGPHVSPTQQNKGCGNWVPFARSSDRRRFGREFYLGPGNPTLDGMGAGAKGTGYTRIIRSMPSFQGQHAAGDDRRPCFSRPQRGQYAGNFRSTMHQAGFQRTAAFLRKSHVRRRCLSTARGKKGCSL